MEIGAKVEHVLAAPHSRGHRCHWPGCQVEVKPAMWGCRPHWYALPRMIRARIWAAYRPGQERTKTPSPAYVEAVRAAEEWVIAEGLQVPEQTVLL